MESREEAETGVIADIHEERVRQIELEGHTIAHDDSQDRGELARMAVCFVLQTENVFTIRDCHPRPVFPATHRITIKPDYRRNLVVGAALLVAEIERVDREAARQEREAQAIEALQKQQDANEAAAE